MAFCQVSGYKDKKIASTAMFRGGYIRHGLTGERCTGSFNMFRVTDSAPGLAAHHT